MELSMQFMPVTNPFLCSCYSPRRAMGNLWHSLKVPTTGLIIHALEVPLQQLCRWAICSAGI